MGVRQLVKMHIPGPPTPLHQHPEEGTWHELVSATSPGDSEVGPLQASLQEPGHLPGESSVPFESLLCGSIQVGLQESRVLKSELWD